MNSSLRDEFHQFCGSGLEPSASKLLDLCEHFWAALDGDPTSAVPHTDDFATLLLRDKHLFLARNVIPELRSRIYPAGLSDAKQALLRRVHSRRQQEPLLNSTIQPRPDEAGTQLAVESSILDGADTFRACVSMCNRPNAEGAMQRNNLREWFNVCPIKNSLSENVEGADAHAIVNGEAMPTVEDAYRVSVLVRGFCKVYDEAERLRLREWLDACPVTQYTGP